MKNINYKDIKKDSIKFITIAEAGAMGKPGEVQLLTHNENHFTLFSGDLIYSFKTIDTDEFYQAFPWLGGLSFLMGMCYGLPEEWEYFSLGCGNNLLVSKDVSEYFKLLAKDEGDSDLYGNWFKYALITLILLDKGYSSKEKFTEMLDKHSQGETIDTSGYDCA
jgi:hypothetical protein